MTSHSLDALYHINIIVQQNPTMVGCDMLKPVQFTGTQVGLIISAVGHS